MLRTSLFGLQRFRSIWIVALANNLLKVAVVFALWRMDEGVVALVVGLRPTAEQEREGLDVTAHSERPDNY